MGASSPPGLRFAIQEIFVESLGNNAEIRVFLAVTRQILIGLQIGELEVEEYPKLDNLCIYHIVIQSELKYLIGVIYLGVELAKKTTV